MDCNYLIIGSGITGLTIALELVNRGIGDILIIDKEPGLGFHASGRNSGVLHSGIYYAPDSLKARFCVQGNRLLREYCEENDLVINRCGKVIVTSSESDLENLMLLKARGEQNGVECKLIDQTELGDLEPFAFTHEMALYSPNTAVFDPLAILNCLKDELESSGEVNFRFNTSFLSAGSGNSASTSNSVINYNRMINCAGAYAERVAHEYGTGDKYEVLPFLGTYKRLKERYSHLVNSNIYPVPDLRNPFLGVHFTRGIDGYVYLGPTAIPVPGRESYKLLKGFSSESLLILYREIYLFLRNRAFRDNAYNEIRKYLSHYVFREARKMLPSLELSYIEHCDKSGIRPQLVDWESKKLVDDFVVLKDDNDNIHVLNAISPAFTCSMAFSSYLADEYI